jgi:glycerol uptake facilitator-like aquaporin
VIAGSVGAWVAAAIVATSSTGFANLAVTVARTLTDSYTGIAPASVPPFVLAQLAAAVAAAVLVPFLFPTTADQAVEPTRIGGDPS